MSRVTPTPCPAGEAWDSWLARGHLDVVRAARLPHAGTHAPRWVKGLLDYNARALNIQCFTRTLRAALHPDPRRVDEVRALFALGGWAAVYEWAPAPSRRCRGCGAARWERCKPRWRA